MSGEAISNLNTADILLENQEKQGVWSLFPIYNFEMRQVSCIYAPDLTFAGHLFSTSESPSAFQVWRTGKDESRSPVSKWK